MKNKLDPDIYITFLDTYLGSDYIALTSFRGGVAQLVRAGES